MSTITIHKGNYITLRQFAFSTLKDALEIQNHGNFDQEIIDDKVKLATLLQIELDVWYDSQEENQP